MDEKQAFIEIMAINTRTRESEIIGTVDQDGLEKLIDLLTYKAKPE